MQWTAAPDQAGPGQAYLPVDDGRDALPGPEACYTLQFFVGDPGRHYELLWIATTQPNGEGEKEGVEEEDREGKRERHQVSQYKDADQATQSELKGNMEL